MIFNQSKNFSTAGVTYASRLEVKGNGMTEKMRKIFWTPHLSYIVIVFRTSVNIALGKSFRHVIFW